MKLVPIIATATLVAGSVVVATAPASAALTLICDGVAADITVPGNLVVRAGEACTLSNVNVAGTTVVRRGADLVVTGGTFSGSVTVRPDGYFDATDAMVEGRLHNTGYAVYAEGVHFGADVITRPSSDLPPPYFFTLDTHVAGGVDSRGAETMLDGTEVEGDVTGTDGGYTDLFDSVVGGGLSVSGMESGAAVCESEVYGDAVFSGNLFGVQLGTTGALAECAGASFWGGDVAIDDNADGVEVSGNIVAGDLSGEGNDPAPVGEMNRVRGEVSGQFADLAAPALAADAVAPQARLLAPTGAPSTEGAQPEGTRQAQVGAKVQQRRAAATAEATAAGKAF